MAVEGFLIWDYISMFTMLILSTGIAFYHVFQVRSSKSSSAREFLVTGKSIGFFPIVLSTVATSISPVSLQGYPYEIYSFGAQFCIFAFTPLVAIFIFLYFILPVFYNLGISSVFQYLEFRFSRSVRIAASIISNSQMILYTSCIIYAPSLAISQVTGIHLWTSVLTIGIVCILYTALGGIKAVIWADAVQFLVMVGVVLVILTKGTMDVGGIAEVFRRCQEGHRLNFYITPSEYSRETIWTFIFGGIVLYLVFITPNQMIIQRILANPNITRAKWSLVVSSFCLSCFSLMFLYLGLILYARYWDCDPSLSGIVTTGDQMVSLFAMEVLSFAKGLPGIFVSGILCAALSTLSSVLNALSTITIMDYINPFYPNLSEKKTMILSKVLAVVYGVICIALVSVAENLGGIVRTIFALSGAIGGPLFAVFALGIFCPWANTKGALSGFSASLAVGAWATAGNLLSDVHYPRSPVSIAGCNFTLLNSTTISHLTNVSAQLNQNFTEPQTIIEYPGVNSFILYQLSPMWYGVLALVVCFVVGVTVSIATGVSNPDELPPGVVAPLIDNFFRSLPEKYRLFFGYKSEKRRQNHINHNEYTKGVEIEEATIPLNKLDEKN